MKKLITQIIVITFLCFGFSYSHAQSQTISFFNFYTEKSDTHLITSEGTDCNGSGVITIKNKILNNKGHKYRYRIAVGPSFPKDVISSKPTITFNNLCNGSYQIIISDEFGKYYGPFKIIIK